MARAKCARSEGVPASGDDLHLAREVAGEGVELLLRGVEVAEGEFVLRDEQVGEAVGGLPPVSVKEVGGILRFGGGFALGLLQFRDGGAAAGDDE